MKDPHIGLKFIALYDKQDTFTWVNVDYLYYLSQSLTLSHKSVYVFQVVCKK